MNNTIAKKVINQNQNGIEIYFSVYPLSKTKEQLKSAGYRWNRKKSCWYIKQTAEAETIADVIANTTITAYQEAAQQTGETVTETGNKAAGKTTTKNTINLDNLGTTPIDWDDISGSIRKELKARNVKGVTVRKTSYKSIYVTIQAGSDDFASIEEMANRYTISHFSIDISTGIYTNGDYLTEDKWHSMTDEEKEKTHKTYLIEKLQAYSRFANRNNRNDDYELTTNFYNKCKAIYKIANQWNYNHSDPYSDYSDFGYVLTLELKRPEKINIRENMTAEEKEAYKKELEAEAAEREALRIKYAKEEAEREERRKKAEERRKAAREMVLNNATIQDLSEEDQLYITNLTGGAGKEADLDELEETISTGHYHINDAAITRKAIFTDPAAYEAFTTLFLDDFDFLEGMGGTGSEDIRLEGVENIYSLNKEQRNSIKWYNVNNVGVYLNQDLKLVIDPQGHNYSRYVYKLSDDSEIINAKEELEKQRKESEAKQPFYFPKPLKDQVEALKPGEEITVYKCDGWILNSIYAGSGIILAIREGNYAQYKGFYIDIQTGKKTGSIFLSDSKQCLVYKGIQPTLPESVTREKINDNLYQLYKYDVLFKKTLEYYESKGIKPVIDTIQR